MIQANELRIGNWVNTENGIGFVSELRFINPDGFNVGVTVPPMQKFVSLNANPNPIPLTPEILEKLGFEDTFYEWTNGDIVVKWSSRIVSNGLRYGLYVEKYDHVQYLHQLQNLYYALTGTELIYNPCENS